MVVIDRTAKEEDHQVDPQDEDPQVDLQDEDHQTDLLDEDHQVATQEGDHQADRQADHQVGLPMDHLDVGHLREIKVVEDHNLQDEVHRQDRQEDRQVGARGTRLTPRQTLLPQPRSIRDNLVPPMLISKGDLLTLALARPLRTAEIIHHTNCSDETMSAQ